jgi:phage gp16-like protein
MLLQYLNIFCDNWVNILRDDSRHLSVLRKVSVKVCAVYLAMLQKRGPKTLHSAMRVATVLLATRIPHNTGLNTRILTAQSKGVLTGM